MLVYNIRPQAMARLRLSYDDVKKVNPRIIYAGCFGYSQRGPYAAKAAYDDLIQGAAGLPWLLKKQGAETPRYAPIIVADRSVGQQVASAVSAALYHREKTGKGQRIDVPMFEHLLQIVLGEHLGGYTFEPQQGEAGLRAHALARPAALPDEGRLRLHADLQRQAVEGVLRPARQAGNGRRPGLRHAGRPQPELRPRLRLGRRGDEKAHHAGVDRRAGARATSRCSA